MDNDLQDEVEILHLVDNKEMTIGMKRQKLYEMANGEYSWMIDDDDWVHYEAVPKIVAVLDGIADCIGFKELCVFDGKRLESSCFSLKYSGWMDNHDGYNHVRTPFFKTPIKTELCLQVGVHDIRWGEDAVFAEEIYPHLKTMTFIDEWIYHYKHNASPHNERYGIKN